MNSPMPELLAAIAAHPDDPFPRWAAADWLEANGQPERAEFIRLQIEIGEALASVQDSLDLEYQFEYRREAAARLDRHDLLPRIQREFDLLRVHGERWLPGSRDSTTWRGGFPTSYEITLADFLQHPHRVQLVPGGVIRLTEIAERLPQPPLDIEALLKPGGFQAFTSRQRFADPTPGIQRLAACPGLAGIERLNLSLNELTGQHLGMLLASPHLGPLRSLDLGSNKIGPTGAEALARCARLNALETLSLWFGFIGTEGAAHLAASPHLRSLRHLEMYSNQLGDEGVLSLARAQGLHSLERISLGYNHFSPAALERFAHAPQWENLRDLNLSGNTTLGDNGLLALAASPLARRLEKLNLGTCNLSAAGTRALASPAFANLRELSLKGEDNTHDAVDLAAIGGSPHLARLQSLWLESMGLDDAAFAPLFDGPGASALHTLALQGNRLTAEGMQAMAASPKMRSLRVLRLRKNSIGPAGAAALAESPHLHGLRWIDLQECALGEEGMLALLRAPWMARLVGFSFGWNKLTDRFALELAKQPFLSQFQRLDLGLNCIGDEGVIALANSPYLANVRRLEFGSNRLGDAACRALADSPYLDRLEILILTDNPATTSAGRLPLWQRFDREGCKFVFGFRKRAEDERSDPEPRQPGDGYRDNHNDEDEEDDDD